MYILGFVENTYFVSFDDDKLPKVAEREHYELKYYQWVSFNWLLCKFYFCQNLKKTLIFCKVTVLDL